MRLFPRPHDVFRFLLQNQNRIGRTIGKKALLYSERVARGSKHVSRREKLFRTTAPIHHELRQHCLNEGARQANLQLSRLDFARNSSIVFLPVFFRENEDSSIDVQAKINTGTIHAELREVSMEYTFAAS